ncbi:MAG: hypothetical protein Q9225_000789 [Loekoesia sp. 1 TL-2023]
MGEKSNTNGGLWIARFDENIRRWGAKTCQHALGTMLKDSLLSDGDLAAANTVHQIDSFYQQEYLTSDPLLKFKDDQGMERFLNGFFEAVFTLASLLPYADPNQGKLVNLLLELRKLPPRQLRIWNEDCLVWVREPIFGLVMEDNWNGNHPSDAKESSGGDGERSFQEICDEWLNFSCFLARCIEAGLNNGYVDRCKYPSIDIPEGLEPDLPRGPKRDCKIMVAIQYILLAGRVVAEDCFKKPVDGFGPKQWERWAKRLGEIASQEDGNLRLASAAKDARKYMASLRPRT